MGLLGTVLGMIQVFAVIKEQGIGQTAALSGGISEALLTTVAGLFIGIPVLIAYNFFTSKAEAISTLVKRLDPEGCRECTMRSFSDCTDRPGNTG